MGIIIPFYRHFYIKSCIIILNPICITSPQARVQSHSALHWQQTEPRMACNQTLHTREASISMRQATSAWGLSKLVNCHLKIEASSLTSQLSLEPIDYLYTFICIAIIPDWFLNADTATQLHIQLECSKLGPSCSQKCPTFVWSASIGCLLLVVLCSRLLTSKIIYLSTRVNIIFQ